MNIEVFAMERFQSEWENRVQLNLSESGVHPLSLEELLDPDERAEVLRSRLVYVQTNGTPALRGAIAALYPPATADHIVVCNGTAEANYAAIWRLVEPGDQVVMMVPNYMQIWGIARGFGATVIPWRLREEREWAPDLDELATLVTPKTRLIAICSPNNPTGAVFSEKTLRGIVSVAERHGAWVLSDEVYRGAELDGQESPSLWGLYDRALVACGLSKAYGLPGLRIGWIVGPPSTVAELWARKDYLSIAPSAISDLVARTVVRPAVRARLLTRTRRIVNANLPILEEWLGRYGDAFRLVPPRAGAFAYPRYRWDVNSTQLICRLRDERGVLLVPGDQFGMDGYIRIGLGNEPEELRAGLDRVSAILEELGRPVVEA
jgi:aspartate/methionine/tyrosine aminotransferase